MVDLSLGKKLTNDERLLVNSELERRGKNVMVAYLLLIFLGTIGVHRFYLGLKGTAITQLVLTLVGWATVLILVGFIPLAIVGVWVFIDLFLLPGIIKSQNAELEKEIIDTL